MYLLITVYTRSIACGIGCMVFGSNSHDTTGTADVAEQNVVVISITFMESENPTPKDDC